MNMLQNSCEERPALCDDQAHHGRSGGPPFDLTEPSCDEQHAGASPSAPIHLTLTESCPASLHAYMSRRGESPFSRQPKIPYSAQLQRDAITWPPRCYACTFCGREFNSAQALGGHMNIHRRDRARLRTISHHSSASPHRHDWPPTDNNPPQPLPSYSSAHFHLPFKAASSQEYCQGPQTPSPIVHISEAPAPFKLQGTAMMIPAADQHPFDYNSFPAPPSNQIPRIHFGNSFAASKLDPSSSLMIRSPELKTKPVANLMNWEAAAIASQSHLTVGGCMSTGATADTKCAQLIQFKELAEVHRKNGSQADAVTSSEELLVCSMQRPFQYSIQRPSSASIAKDFHSVDGAAAGPTSPNKDSLACLDLELRLGRRSSLSAAAADNCMQPSPPRRPP